MCTVTVASHSAILETLTGTIRFRLTNAYMFVAVLQKNHETLCHLIAALLHIKRSDIVTVEILNPIILGDDIGKKDIVLDLRILLNNNVILNIEMQINNEGNWDDRTLYYLSKNLVLAVGEDYTELKPVIQIGILDFNYPDGNTEFYQKYVLMNRETHRIFSDKLGIYVLCLSQMENATEEDRQSGLYEWAKVFKATTWEELKALSENNPVIENTIVTMAELSENEKVREQLLREEKAQRDKLSAQNYGYRKGIVAGFIDGHEKGFADGHEKGFADGREKGFADGRKKGFADGREKGFADGREKGFADGHDQGLTSLSRLIQLLIEAGRQDEIARVTSDMEYQKKLLSEFRLL